MAYKPPNVIVMIHPNPGKEARVEELVKWVTGEVHKTEPWISWYRVCTVPEQGENKDITDTYIAFRLDDMSKMDSRRELNHHQVVAKAVREENLLREPLQYRKFVDVDYWSR